MTLRTFVSRTVTALAFTMFSAAGLAAQSTGTITGLVRDGLNLSPLAGAQVSIEGTGIGGLVNNVGRFLLLNVPAGTQTVNVTMIGYGAGTATITVTAGGTAANNFDLRQQALNLEGVIVTGTAGQARRREVGNSIESVGQADIAVAAVTDIGDILQGRAAGVQISDTDGQVGAGSEIRIRGNSSVSQGNRPLIYIDGIRMETGTLTLSDEAAATPMALDAINPQDIDRIEIVKGPAATTLYGTEAAGGVIQIFTKRGSAGAPAWTVSVDGGLSRMGHQGPNGGADLGEISNMYTQDPANSALYPDGTTGLDWLNADDETLNANGLRLNDCATGDPLTRYSTINGYAAEPGCPANGAWLRDAYMKRYNLSVRGGGETATYFVSGRYADEEGVVDPQGQASYNARANVQFQPFDGLDISVNNMYTSRSIDWIPNGNNASGLFLNVLRGERGYTPDNDDSLVLVNDINTKLSQWVTSASVGWSPSQNFSHRLNFGMDYNYSDYTDFKPYGNYEYALGSRQNDTRSDRNLTFDYNGSWRTDVTAGIASSFSWGGQVYEEFGWGLEGRDGDFAGPGDQLVGDGTLPFSDEDRLTIRSGGFFLQEQIGLGDRLFITGGVRWDGFSTFGAGFGLAAYPKLSAAYTISDESFFPQGGFIDAMKLRAAWGKSGRAPGAFDAVKVYGAVQADELVPALTISNLGNADLGPEISMELEAGFEMSMFEGRVSADFTWYDQKTLDALIGVQEAPSFGTDERTLRNLGETENKGTESVLNVVAWRSDNLEWSVSGAYSTNNSKIVDLGPLQDAGSNLRLGFPIGVNYSRTVLNPTATGEKPVYSDEVLGGHFPTQIFSLGTRVTINQALTLDVLAEGQQGHYKSVGLGWATTRRETWPACFGIQDSFNATGLTNITPAQAATCVPSYVQWGMWTDAADFLKIRSASLSYRLPDGLIPGARSMTLALQAKNLFVFTDYQGLDPEASDRGNSRGESAFEYYNMAPPRIIILNVTVNF
jgi:TonB-linked SusC/RagA family outer membrane protein